MENKIRKGILYVDDYKNPKYYECVKITDNEIVPNDYIIEDIIDFSDGFDNCCVRGDPNNFVLVYYKYSCCESGCTGYRLEYFVVDNDVTTINKKNVDIKTYDDKHKTTIVHNNSYATLSYTYDETEVKDFLNKIKTAKHNMPFTIGKISSYASLFSYTIVKETNEPILQENPPLFKKCLECGAKIIYHE